MDETRENRVWRSKKQSNWNLWWINKNRIGEFILASNKIHSVFQYMKVDKKNYAPTIRASVFKDPKQSERVTKTIYKRAFAIIIEASNPLHLSSVETITIISFSFIISNKSS